jgi:putative DNA primase/helicase
VIDATIEPAPINPMLEAALAMARRGLHISPLAWLTHSADGKLVCACPKGTACKSPGKHPRTENGQHDATTDERTIRAWWAKWPTANIGLPLAPNNLIAFDIDTPEGHATLAELEHEYGLCTARQKSGSGNLHVLARKPPHKIRGHYRGITLRGDNYIVVAPSLHRSGGRYEWISAPWDVDPIELPAALAEKIKRSESTAPAKSSTTQIVNEVQVKRAKAWLAKAEPAIEGQHGHARLFAVCCKLVHGFGLGDSDALSAILSDYNPRCDPPWNDDEVDEIERKICQARKTCDNPVAFAVEDRPFKKRSDRAEPDERDVHDDEATVDRDEDPGAHRDDRDAPHHAEQRDEVRERRERKRKPKAPVVDDLGVSDHPGLGPDGGYRLTDLGNARRFADLHRDRLRYVPAWNRWLAWDGRRWHRDELGSEREAGKKVVAQIYAEAASAAARASAAAANGPSESPNLADGSYAELLTKHARSTGKRSGIENMIAMARTETGIVSAANVFDADRFALNVMNGTIDLRDGELREHRQADMITMLSPVTYDAQALAPTWEAFLKHVLPDADVRTWVQRYLGYALTGDTREQCLAFYVGGGANGKSVLLDVVLGVLGDYGLRAAPDLVLAKQGEAHPTEIADLEGRRLVVCSEIEQGRTWAESTIKRLTGDATIKARHMREDFYTFAATHKLIVAANTRPTVRGTDHGIWRRMRLVPWTVTIPDDEQDRTLPQKLLTTEASGILAWLVQGCLAWQRVGLGKASAIDVATNGYREDMDLLGRWMEDRCAVGDDLWCATSSLYANYKTWCESEGLDSWSRRAWHDRLIERGGGIRDGKRGARSEIRALVGLALRGAP